MSMTREKEALGKYVRACMLGLFFPSMNRFGQELSRNVTQQMGGD